MGEKEARALGSGSKIVVNDVEYTLRPITVQHLCDLEREALQFYKRQSLETITANADLLGSRADELIRDKLEELAKLSLDDLPRKMAYDASRLPVTDKLRAWAQKYNAEIGGMDGKLSDARVKTLVVTALDREQLTSDKVKELTGRRPVQARVRYDQWWVTGCFEGMVSFIHSSIRHDHPNVSKQQIRDWPVSAIFESAREVESITMPNLGNG